MIKRILPWLNPPKVLTLFLSVSAFEALATVLYQLSMPADPANSVFLGYSLKRLAVIAVIFVLCLLLIALAIKSARDPQWSSQTLHFFSKGIIAIPVLVFLMLVFLSCFTLALTPPLRFMPYDLFFKGLLPPIRLAAIVSAEAALLLIALRFGFHPERLSAELQNERKVVHSIFVFAGITILAWLFITISGFGLKPDVAYWNSPGVPLQSVQVLVALVISIGFLIAGLLPVDHHRNQTPQNIPVSGGIKTDLIICLLLWLFSAALWMYEPQVRSFFGPGPSAPNQEFYPLSDAAGYDIAAQYALIGQGLDNGHHVDKPLYSTLLIFFHLLAGQNYARLVMFQSAFLALIPALLYLLGKTLHSRPAGVLAALLAAFKGQNAIASAWMVLSANPKLIISEYPMMLGMVAFSFFMVKWLKSGQKSAVFGMLAGSMFALTTMIRHNVWIVLPFALLLLWLVNGLKWQKALRSSLVFLGMLFITLLPWMWRTYQETQTPLFFMPMLENVFSQRYDINLPGMSWSTPVPAIPTVSSDTVAPITHTRQTTDDSELPISYTWQEKRPAGTGIYDDSDSALSYQGDWFSIEDSKAFQQTLQFSTVAGSSAHLRFSGEQVTLAYPTAPEYGELEISIDGEVVERLPQNNTETESLSQWQSDALDNGIHELVLSHRSGKMVGLDAIAIKGPAPLYQRSDECPSGVPYHWIHASLDSGLHSDDGVAVHQMPFFYRLNGEAYQNVYISANGLISFEEFASGTSQTSAIPDRVSPNQFIAPFWIDLDPSAGGTVLYDIFGAPPHRMYVIEWRSVPLKSGAGNATFEVILFEGSSDILFQYGEMPPAEASSQAIVGLEYTQGLEGTVVVNDPQHAVHAGLSILLSNAARECQPCYDIRVEARPSQGGEVQMLPLPNCGNKYTAGTMLSLSAGAGQYSSQWAESVIASSMSEGYTLPVGAPKTETCDDSQQAWSASKWGYQPEWLVLTYPQAVHAAGVSIHESNLGGFVYQIDFIEPDGSSHTVWQGTETTTCGEWFTPPLELEGISTPYRVKSVKVYTRKWGWEQIDAVKLVHLEDSGYRFSTWNIDQAETFTHLEVNHDLRLAATFQKEALAEKPATQPENQQTTTIPHKTPTPQPRSALTEEEIHEGNSFSAAGDGARMSWFIPSHFIHNWISSALTLPLTLINDDLRNTLTDQQSVWGQNWQGQMSAGSMLLFLLNLIFVITGSAWAWARWRFAGILPWVTFGAYSLGTAVARTSGGRYIVPIDWVFYLYFALGLVQACIWLASLLGYAYTKYSDFSHFNETAPQTHIKPSAQRALLITTLLICLLAGASPLLAERAFPPYFEPLSKEQAYLKFLERGAADSLKLDDAELAAFVHQQDSYVWQGKILYPRFYQAGEGEPAGGMYGVMDFPRLVFTIIGPGGPNIGARAANGVLPMPKAPGVFPQGADAIVIGCRSEGANVLAVLLMNENGDQVYLGSPEVPLSCPLQEPQCDHEGNCQ